jgi:regulatory protein
MKDKNTKTKPLARDKALLLLAKSDRTEKQMRDSLARLGYTQAETDDTIDFLIEFNYINDADYAEKYLKLLIAKGRGRCRVTEEMYSKGLSREIIDRTISDGYSEETEKELALAVAKMVKSALPEDMAPREKAPRISQKLKTRGFGYDVIAWALDSVIE